MNPVRFRGCHAESYNANTFNRIGVEACSRTVALLVHCRFGRGPDLYRAECRPMTNWLRLYLFEHPFLGRANLRFE
jgi:hypothetical protein